MKLNFDQIKSIALGAERIAEESDGVHFYRFTKEQEDLYIARKAGFNQYYATSGVSLRFITNSETMFLKVFTSAASARNFFSFDVYADRKFLDSINNFHSKETPRFPENAEPFGDFEKSFTLPKGEKEVRIYFPWSAAGVLKELHLDDGASLLPVKPNRRLLCFGDSITQGYDALFTSRKYTTLLADYLDAEEFNKAMGGDGFFPELVVTKEDFVPDYVIGAYGTNDWTYLTPDKFDLYSRMFYENLAKTYPTSKIYAISPLWRKDYQNDRTFGRFVDIENHLRNTVADLENITLIPGMELVDHNEELFRELSLHPNDAGYAQYAENLKKYIPQ